MISLETRQQKKGSHLAWRRKYPVLLELQQVPLELRQGPQGPAYWPQDMPDSIRVVRALSGFLSISAGPKSSSGAEVRTEFSSPVLTHILVFL